MALSLISNQAENPKMSSEEKLNDESDLEDGEIEDDDDDNNDNNNNKDGGNDGGDENNVSSTSKASSSTSAVSAAAAALGFESHQQHHGEKTIAEQTLLNLKDAHHHHRATGGGGGNRYNQSGGRGGGGRGRDREREREKSNRPLTEAEKSLLQLQRIDRERERERNSKRDRKDGGNSSGGEGGGGVGTNRRRDRSIEDWTNNFEKAMASVLNTERSEILDSDEDGRIDRKRKRISNSNIRNNKKSKTDDDQSNKSLTLAEDMDNTVNVGDSLLESVHDQQQQPVQNQTVTRTVTNSYNNYQRQRTDFKRNMRIPKDEGNSLGGTAASAAATSTMNQRRKPLGNETKSNNRSRPTNRRNDVSSTTTVTTLSNVDNELGSKNATVSTTDVTVAVPLPPTHQQPQQLQHKEEICSFFLQGKCHKNEECPFSHDANPPLKMELCKFYLMSECVKRTKCLYLHEEFPCKFYHMGMKCMAGDSCRFAHGCPLPENLKAVLLKHIETVPKEYLGEFPRLTKEGAFNMLNNCQTVLRENKTAEMNGGEKKPNEFNVIPSLFDLDCSIPPGFRPHIPPPNIDLKKKRPSRWDDSSSKFQFYGCDQPPPTQPPIGAGSGSCMVNGPPPGASPLKIPKFSQPPPQFTSLPPPPLPLPPLKTILASVPPPPLQTPINIPPPIAQPIQQHDSEPIFKSSPLPPPPPATTSVTTLPLQPEVAQLADDSIAKPEELMEAAIDKTAEAEEAQEVVVEDKAMDHDNDKDKKEVAEECGSNNSKEEIDEVPTAEQTLSSLPPKQRELFLRILERQKESLAETTPMTTETTAVTATTLPLSAQLPIGPPSVLVSAPLTAYFDNQNDCGSGSKNSCPGNDKDDEDWYSSDDEDNLCISMPNEDNVAVNEPDAEEQSTVIHSLSPTVTTTGTTTTTTTSTTSDPSNFILAPSTFEIDWSTTTTSTSTILPSFSSSSVITPPASTLTTSTLDLSKIDISAEVTKLLSTLQKKQQQQQQSTSNMDEDVPMTRNISSTSNQQQQQQQQQQQGPIENEESNRHSIYDNIEWWNINGGCSGGNGPLVLPPLPIDLSTDSTISEMGGANTEPFVDFNQFKFQLKGIENYTPAMEIDASLKSHRPLIYKVHLVDIPKPCFNHLKVSRRDPIVRQDPRLRRIFRIDEADDDNDDDVDDGIDATNRNNDNQQKGEERRNQTVAASIATTAGGTSNSTTTGSLGSASGDSPRSPPPIQQSYLDPRTRAHTISNTDANEISKQATGAVTVATLSTTDLAQQLDILKESNFYKTLTSEQKEMISHELMAQITTGISKDPLLAGMLTSIGLGSAASAAASKEKSTRPPLLGPGPGPSDHYHGRGNNETNNSNHGRGFHKRNTYNTNSSRDASGRDHHHHQQQQQHPHQHHHHHHNHHNSYRGGGNSGDNSRHQWNNNRWNSRGGGGASGNPGKNFNRSHRPHNQQTTNPN